MEEQLEQMVLAHGLRAVVNAIAALAERYGEVGMPLPYDTKRAYREVVCSEDLATVAANLRGDLY